MKYKNFIIYLINQINNLYYNKMIKKFSEMSPKQKKNEL